MSVLQLPPEEADLPPITAETVLFGALLSALVEVLPERKSKKLLQTIFGILESVELTGDIMRMRGPRQLPAVMLARRSALAWFRKALPLFMERL